MLIVPSFMNVVIEIPRCEAVTRIKYSRTA